VGGENRGRVFCLATRKKMLKKLEGVARARGGREKSPGILAPDKDVFSGPI